MKYLLLFVPLVVLLGACKKTMTGCDNNPGSTVAAVEEEAMVTKYLDSMSITNAVELEGSGMYYIIDAPGNTKRAGQCSVITVEYKGYYRNGSIFDQTNGVATNFGGYPLSNLIEGWRRGLPLIGEGGTIRLFIPPSLAYGVAGRFNPNTGQFDIPPNAVMIFEMELEKIQ